MGDDAGAFSQVGIEEPEAFLGVEGIGTGPEVEGFVISEVVLPLDNGCLRGVFIPAPELALVGLLAGHENTDGGAAVVVVGGSDGSLPMGAHGTNHGIGCDTHGLTAFEEAGIARFDEINPKITGSGF
mgnify:CR=1 FL=1